MRYLLPAKRVPNDPSGHILTVGEVKDALRISGSANDARINAIIDSIDVLIPNYIRRPVVEQSVSYLFDACPCRKDVVMLPRSPIQSIDSFNLWTPETDSYAPVASSDWIAHGLHDAQEPPTGPCIIDPADEWELVAPENYRYPIRVTTTSGWSTIPAGIKEGATRLAVSLFVHRSTKSEYRLHMLGPEVTRPLDQYRRRRFVVEPQ